ncbi:MAG: translation initiation factor IF-3 [Bdellovibrionales bacterium]|nr:translation initiation factor IF-3 [Bdellovibrionales bacterium]
MNQEIFAQEVRLIDENGEMMGVMPPREALAIAENRGLDLIEIAPNAKPPTCKIMDYGKWKYENKKKEKVAKKKQTVISIKEVQLRPRTEQHDLDVKMRHARRFLIEGDKVKLNLRFSGREMAHQELGLQLLKDVSKGLEDVAVVEVPPKMEGRQMFVLMAPDPAKIKDYLKANKDIAPKVSEPKAPEVKAPEAKAE